MVKQFSNLSLFEFTRRAIIAGHISLKGILRLPVYYLQIVPTLPFRLLQNLLFSNKIERTAITKDPIFILGHYRSGTSLLQKLMVSDSRFGFLTYYDSLFPNTNLLFGIKSLKLFQFIADQFKIKNPFFHETNLKLTEPDEEDDYMINKVSPYSAYWGIIFPHKWKDWLNSDSQLSEDTYIKGWIDAYLKTIRFITFKNQGKQLILKSPPNTGRIRFLLTLFPNAKFIFLHRNPYNLYYSTLNMWKRAIIKYYSVQHVSDMELDEIIFGHYKHLMECYDRDKKFIKQGNLVELSYEELQTDPFGTIQRIYTELDIPDFILTEKSLLDRIHCEKKYTTFHHQYSLNKLETIKDKWGTYINRWDYKKPQVL